MTEHGPHCATCTCGCTCGYGGQHDDRNPRCDLNQPPLSAEPVVPPTLSPWEWACPTPGCAGDARYTPPGRGHATGCTYPANLAGDRP